MTFEQRHLKFEVAFKNASNNPREAPWYGVYNWILSQVVFLDLCDAHPLDTLTTITYPQYPLTKDIDTDMREEYDEDDEDHEGVMDMMDAEDLATKFNHGDTNHGTLSTPPGLVRAMAPSPESDNPNFHNFSHFGSPSSPLVRYQKARSVGPGGVRVTMAPSPPELRISARNRHPWTKRSTRVPDFVELLHLDGDHLISSVLLIVEIKKEPPPTSEIPGPFTFHSVLKQTRLQAMHAFLSADFLHVSTVGAIVALGRYWKYIEYTRATAFHPSNHPDLRSSSQQSYGSMSPSPDRMRHESWLKYDKFEEKCEPGVFHCTLRTKNSDEAFLVVRERMIQLAHEHHGM